MTPAMREIRKNGDKIRADREERLKEVDEDYENAIDELIDWSYKPTLKERIISWAYYKYIRIYNWVWRKFICKPEYIACERCGEEYETYTHGQAYGLCSTVDFENKKLRGHYGSDYDLKEFDIVDISEIPGQDICDKCITLLCDQGVLVNERYWNVWEGVDETEGWE